MVWCFQSLPWAFHTSLCPLIVWCFGTYGASLLVHIPVKSTPFCSFKLMVSVSSCFFSSYIGGQIIEPFIEHTVYYQLRLNCCWQGFWLTLFLEAALVCIQIPLIQFVYPVWLSADQPVALCTFSLTPTLNRGIPL